MEEKKVNIREMTMEDFEEVHALWMGIHGFGIRSIDDSKEGVERFTRRNPTTSMVACENDRIIGAILCGHDGRRGCLYHVCVHEDYRKQGIGQKMVEACLAALKREHVNKVNLIAFKKNGTVISGSLSNNLFAITGSHTNDYQLLEFPITESGVLVSPVIGNSSN
jgi:ribosomal protein S18 acetylase RimI-like enzyme